MDIAKRRVCDTSFNMLQQMCCCAIMNDNIDSISSSGIIGCAGVGIGSGGVGVGVGISIGSMNNKSNNGRIIWDEERNIVDDHCQT